MEKMTIARLNQYYSLVREIPEIENRIMTMESCASRRSAAQPDDATKRQIAAWKRLKTQAEKECAEVERFINSTTDSIARRAMRMRFIERRSWTNISMQLGYTSESSARVLCKREIQKHTISERMT